MKPGGRDRLLSGFWNSEVLLELMRESLPLLKAPTETSKGIYFPATGKGRKILSYP